MKRESDDVHSCHLGYICGAGGDESPRNNTCKRTDPLSSDMILMRTHQLSSWSQAVFYNTQWC
jgi:hypothetical protein